MKIKFSHGHALTVAGITLALSMTGCADKPGQATTSNAPESVSAATSSAPESISAMPSESAKIVSDSREGDDIGVVVNDVRYVVEKSFYANEIKMNAGSEYYPQWQKAEAPSGSRFLVVDGTVVNESKQSVYPYAPITFAVQAEASDGSTYGMASDSNAADKRVVPKLHTLAPHYETTVRYIYTIPTFIDIEHMTMTPFGSYMPDQIKRVKINP